MTDLFQDTGLVPVVVDAKATQLTVAPPPSFETRPNTLLADLREYAMALPPEQIVGAMEEYMLSRTTFRDWLLSKLEPGVHYGYPPGCEPTFQHREAGEWGPAGIYYKGFKGWFHEGQWKPRPSFYQSGADFVIDLMGLQPLSNPDEVAQRMIGKPCLVYRCDLHSRATDKKIGEGHGAREIGQKGGDLNNCVKMAVKAAKVAAVLNTYGLSDLFTQDLEDGPPGPKEAPDTPRNQNQPKVPPRNERKPPEVTGDDMKRLGASWCKFQGVTVFNDAAFLAWVRGILKEKCPALNPDDRTTWGGMLTKAQFDQLMRAIP